MILVVPENSIQQGSRCETMRTRLRRSIYAKSIVEAAREGNFGCLVQRHIRRAAA
jgi:hypothetical protein